MVRTLPSLLEIADPDDIREKLDAVRATAKDELALKRGVVSVLKQALGEGREKARERLEQGAHRGRACAEALGYLHDAIISELYTYANHN